MTNNSQKRNLPRSIGAVFAGLVVIVVLSTAVDMVMHGTGVFPPPGQPMAASLWLLATAYRIVISVAGCYLTAWLVATQPMKHALVLGWIGVAISTLGTVLTWNKGPSFGPKWYPLALIAVAIPCAWIGGRLALSHKTRLPIGVRLSPKEGS
jgi:hypothetical protein